MMSEANIEASQNFKITDHTALENNHSPAYLQRAASFGSSPLFNLNPTVQYYPIVFSNIQQTFF